MYYILHASVRVDRVSADTRVERNALFPLVTGSPRSPSASCEIVSITGLLGFLQLDDECVARVVELSEQDASGIDGVFRNAPKRSSNPNPNGLFNVAAMMLDYNKIRIKL